MGVPVAVFIFLIWFILFRRKTKKGFPLNRKEAVGFWISVIATVGCLVVACLLFIDDIASYLIPYVPYIKNAVCVILGIILISIIVIVIIRHKAGIRQALVKRAHENLERKIRKELETEATAKNLTFPHQQKDEVISKLSNRLSSDIMNGSTPKDYSAQPMTDRVGDVYLGGCYLTIPFSTAKSLADKMTELSNDPRYRKKRKLPSCLVGSGSSASDNKRVFFRRIVSTKALSSLRRN